MSATVSSLNMNWCHVLILVVSFYFFSSQCITPPPVPDGCPATNVAAVDFKDVFVGNFKILYNISTVSPDSLDCFYYMVGDVNSDNQTINLTSYFQIYGMSFMRNATVYIIPNSPAYDKYDDDDEVRYFSFNSTNNIITVIDCNMYGTDYFVACNASNCGRDVQSTASRVAQTVATNLGVTLPLSSYMVNFTRCSHVPST